jgi:NADP-dependent 3-hydroxy acid dehydrogenase YdfG
MSEKPERIPRYTEFQKPEFKSQIPAHLTEKLDAKERFMLEAISRMEQEQAWLIRVVLETNKATIESDLRMQEVQDWKQMVTYKASGVVALALIVMPLLVEWIFGKITGAHKP